MNHITRCCATTSASALMILVGATVALLPVVASQDAKHAQEIKQEHDEDHHHEENALHDHMEEINDALREAFRAVGREDGRDDALAAVAKLQEHVLGAKKAPVPNVDAQPDASRDAYRIEFRRAIAEVLVEAAKLELDILDGKYDVAAKRIRETMIGLRDKAHEKYRVD